MVPADAADRGERNTCVPARAGGVDRGRTDTWIVFFFDTYIVTTTQPAQQTSTATMASTTMRDTPSSVSLASSPCSAGEEAAVAQSATDLATDDPTAPHSALVATSPSTKHSVDELSEHETQPASRAAQEAQLLALDQHVFDGSVTVSPQLSNVACVSMALTDNEPAVTRSTTLRAQPATRINDEKSWPFAPPTTSGGSLLVHSGASPTHGLLTKVATASVPPSSTCKAATWANPCNSMVSCNPAVSIRPALACRFAAAPGSSRTTISCAHRVAPRVLPAS
mmetsp:Transcript_14189/g.44671  ORF Transcript_14189/g.44671 Transcript_14189/m.44671 type:complete len:281 (-) Transcript_14189:338-1180(-)